MTTTSPRPGPVGPRVQRSTAPPLDDVELAHLLDLRVRLRRLQRDIDERAGALGVTPAQHLLLLAAAGHDHPVGPTVGDVADYLAVRHHSAVELVDRAAEGGLVERTRDPEDARRVRLVLTPHGRRTLQDLSALHRTELTRLAPLAESLDGARAAVEVAPVQRRERPPVSRLADRTRRAGGTVGRPRDDGPAPADQQPALTLREARRRRVEQGRRRAVVREQ